VNGQSANAAVGTVLDDKTVAVLYFDYLSPDSSLGYLADGLTETLIDQLRQVRDLEVLSKDAVGQFRGKDVSTDSIAGVLESGTLVRGSVSESGNRLRVSFNVIDGNSGGDRAPGKAV
jgi:adenylate cyclase